MELKCNSKSKEALTVVRIDFGETIYIYLRSWDLPIPGSPSKRTLMSPLILWELLFFGTPPTILNKSAVFSTFMSWIDGAIELIKISK